MLRNLSKVTQLVPNPNLRVFNPFRSPSGPPGAAQTPRPDSPEGCSEEEEGPAREGPELLDFGVDEVAEQLTLMDVVSTQAGQAGGQARRGAAVGQTPWAQILLTPPTTFLPTSLRPGALFEGAALRVPGLGVVTAGPSRGHKHCPHCACHCDPVQHGDRLRAGLGAGRAGPGRPAEGAAAGEVDPNRPGMHRRGRGEVEAGLGWVAGNKAW